ncbi:hypothetical protein B0H14DRAFT_2567568 [Mycena olivaceomarginata]|nr:hypothetical protein B0H14DRAFT_2567568 [Mycena olivaceomarginata]
MKSQCGKSGFPDKYTEYIERTETRLSGGVSPSLYTRVIRQVLLYKKLTALKGEKTVDSTQPIQHSVPGDGTECLPALEPHTGLILLRIVIPNGVHTCIPTGKNPSAGKNSHGSEFDIFVCKCLWLRIRVLAVALVGYLRQKPGYCTTPPFVTDGTETSRSHILSIAKQAFTKVITILREHILVATL